MMWVLKRWSSRLVALVLFLLLCIVLWTAQGQIVFERALNTLYITTDDFHSAGPAYPDALAEAGRDYFDYEFPSPPPNSSLTIPAIIHFIFFPDLYGPRPETPIAHEGSDAPEWCEKHSPAFQINVWNETAVLALLEKEYTWFLPTYHAYSHPIQRVDAAKYFILWHYGGIYLDLDVSCRKALNPLVDFPAWFPRATPMGVNNDVMAIRAGHPLMWKMIDSLKKRNKSLLFPWVTIFWSTGPKFTSDMLQEFLAEHGPQGANNAKVPIMRNSDPNAVYVLPREFYSEEFTFFGHSPGGTWHEDDVAVVLWLVDHPYVVWIGVPVLIVTAFWLVLRIRRNRRRKQIRTTGIELSSVEDGRQEESDGLLHPDRFTL